MEAQPHNVQDLKDLRLTLWCQKAQHRSDLFWQHEWYQHNVTLLVLVLTLIGEWVKNIFIFQRFMKLYSPRADPLHWVHFSKVSHHVPSVFWQCYLKTFQKKLKHVTDTCVCFGHTVWMNVQNVQFYFRQCFCVVCRCGSTQLLRSLTPSGLALVHLWPWQATIPSTTVS